MLLLYDGIHYDPLVLQGADGSVVQTLFPTSDDVVLVEAVAIAKAAFEVNIQKYSVTFPRECLEVMSAYIEG